MFSFADSKTTTRERSIWNWNSIKDEIRIPTQVWTTPKPSEDEAFERALDALLELTRHPYVGVFIVMILEMTYEERTLLHAASCYSKKMGWNLFDLHFGDHAPALNDLASTFEVYLYTIQKTSIHMLSARKLWLRLFEKINASLQRKKIGDSAERTKLRLKRTNTPTTSDDGSYSAYPMVIDECLLEFLIKNMQKVSSYKLTQLILKMGPGDWKELETGYYALTGVAITEPELKEHSKRIAGMGLAPSFNHPRAMEFTAEVELATKRKSSRVALKYGAGMWKSTIDKASNSGSDEEEVRPGVPIALLSASLSTPTNILASSHNTTSERAKTYENPTLEATRGQIMEISNTSTRKRKREDDDPLQAGGCQVQSMIPTAPQIGAPFRALGSAKHQSPYSNSRNIELPPISLLLNIKKPIVESMKWDPLRGQHSAPPHQSAWLHFSETVDFLRYFRFDYGLHQGAIFDLFLQHFSGSAPVLSETQLLTVYEDGIHKTDHVTVFGLTAMSEAKINGYCLCDVAPERAKGYSWVTETHKYAIQNPSRRDHVYYHYANIKWDERETTEYYYGDIRARALLISF